MCAFVSDQRAAGPAVLRDNLAQPIGVRDVDSAPLQRRLGIHTTDELEPLSLWRLADRWSSAAIRADSAAKTSSIPRQ